MTRSNSFRSNGNQSAMPVTPEDLGQISQRRDGGDDIWEHGVGGPAMARSRKGPTCPAGTICPNCPHQTNGVCH